MLPALRLILPALPPAQAYRALSETEAEARKKIDSDQVMSSFGDTGPGRKMDRSDMATFKGCLQVLEEVLEMNAKRDKVRRHPPCHSQHRRLVVVVQAWVTCFPET